MMEETLNINELIKVESLPIIFYQLETIGKAIDDQLVGIDQMVCTENNKQEVKKRRASINKLNTIMEDKRKAIKKEILKDYEVFNEKYEEEIKSKLTYASGVLGDKINEIESEQKHERTVMLTDFANEYIKFHHLEAIIEPKDVIPPITLSASEKSLKEAIKGQIEGIADTVRLINNEEYANEVMIEYKKSLDYIKAKNTVLERHKMMKLLEEQQEEIVRRSDEESKIVESVEEIVAPREIIEEQIVSSTFTVKTTVDNLKKIKAFLEELGVEYE